MPGADSHHGLAARAGRPPRTILVVDDDEIIRHELVEALRDEGFALLSACDGAEALAQIAARRPDLVLLDLMMPRVSGWQVLDELQRDRRLNDIPVFVLTAAHNAAGVKTGYPTFVKPLHMTRLSRTIKSFLGSG
jgi:CheY-like chemotaxis protein